MRPAPPPHLLAWKQGRTHLSGDSGGKERAPVWFFLRLPVGSPFLLQSTVSQEQPAKDVPGRKGDLGAQNALVCMAGPKAGWDSLSSWKDECLHL